MSFKAKIIFSVIGLLLFVGVVFGISVPVNYNKAVEKEEAVRTNYALISTSLEAMFVNMEHLLGAINGLEEHVQTQLSKITEARSKLVARENLNDITNAVENSFNDIIVIIEDNPDSFIAEGAYREYMFEITAKISAVRNAKDTYNRSVQSYNTFIRQFPRNIYIKSLGFKKMELYDPNLLK